MTPQEHYREAEKHLALAEATRRNASESSWHQRQAEIRVQLADVGLKAAEWQVWDEITGGCGI